MDWKVLVIITSYYLACLTICVSVEYCGLGTTDSLVSVEYEFSSSSAAGK